MKLLIAFFICSLTFNQQKEAKEDVSLRYEWDPPTQDFTSWYATNKNKTQNIEIKVRLYNYAPSPLTYNEIKYFVIKPREKRFICSRTPAQSPTNCILISARYIP